MHQTNPPAATVALWLKNIDREQLQGDGWIEINKRFQGIIRAAHPFLQEQFASEESREAAIDGLTLALLAVSHFEDIEKMTQLFLESTEGRQGTDLPSSRQVPEKPQDTKS